MGLELRHFLYALIVAVIVYVFREVHRYRMRIRPRRPEITMEEAWAELDPNDRKHPDRALLPAEPLVFTGPVREDAERAVLEAERRSEAARSSRLGIRTAILGHATMSLHLEAICAADEPARAALIQGYDASMARLLDDALASSTLKWLTLRNYARWKFDDAVPNDWFHQFYRLARPYIREKVRLARRQVLEVDESASRFVQIYDQLLSETGQRLLKARPKRRFVPPDLPGS